MTTYVYELVGPLVDDIMVTRDAYRHAANVLGQIPPHLKPGYTDSQCGVDAKTYNRRTAAYRARAMDVRTGWAAEHARRKITEQESCDLYLFTSHQGDTVHILYEQPNLRWLDKIQMKLYRMDPADRLHRLTALKERGPVVYICADWWHDYVTSVDGPRGVLYVPSVEALGWLDEEGASAD